MSDYVDTIRPRIRHADTVVLGTGAHPSFCKGCTADAALDALVAETQRLEHERDFLQRELGFKNTLRQENRRLRAALAVAKPYMKHAEMSELAQVNAALAATPSEDAG
jgi:hypothetical protein